MFQNEYADTLMKSIMGGFRWFSDWVSSLFTSGGTAYIGGLFGWFAQNWLKLLVVLIVTGVVIDWIVWMVRWRPYWLWGGGRKRREADDYDDDDFDDYRDMPRPHFKGSAQARRRTYADEEDFEDEYDEDEYGEYDEEYEDEAYEDYEDEDEYGEYEYDVLADEEPEAEAEPQRPSVQGELDEFWPDAAAPAAGQDELDLDLTDLVEDSKPTQSESAGELTPPVDHTIYARPASQQAKAPDVAKETAGSDAWRTGYTSKVPVAGSASISRRERRRRQEEEHQ